MLHDVTHGSGSQGAFGIERFIMHGYDQHRQLFKLRLDVLDEIQAAGAAREISTITTSGLELRIPTIASVASGASPQTLMVDSRSINWRKPSRNMV